MCPTLFYSVTQMPILFLELYGYEEPLNSYAELNDRYGSWLVF